MWNLLKARVIKNIQKILISHVWQESGQPRDHWGCGGDELIEQLESRGDMCQSRKSPLCLYSERTNKQKRDQPPRHRISDEKWDNPICLKISLSLRNEGRGCSPWTSGCMFTRKRLNLDLDIISKKGELQKYSSRDTEGPLSYHLTSHLTCNLNFLKN